MSKCLDCTINEGSALQTPASTCSADGLSYDDETFFRARSAIGRGRLHANSHAKRKRPLDTICIGCRRKEEDAKKGHQPSFDVRTIELGRLVEKMQWTRYRHAKSLNLPVSELAKHGWIPHLMAERVLAGGPDCPCCRLSFGSIDDVTLDVRVPGNGLSYEWNVWHICGTCQQGKKRFTTERQIELWKGNWARWHEHQTHRTQHLLFPQSEIPSQLPTGPRMTSRIIEELTRPPAALSVPLPPERAQLRLVDWAPALCWNCGTDRGADERCPKCGRFEAPDA